MAAATSVIVAIRVNNRLLLAGITLVTAWLVVRWTTDLLATNIRLKTSSSPTNQSAAWRFVSLCPYSFDGRRLGNQLFNWAAMLYVARLAGLKPSSVLYTWV